MVQIRLRDTATSERGTALTSPRPHAAREARHPYPPLWRAHGPIERPLTVAETPARRSETTSAWTVPVLSTRQQRTLVTLVGIWFGALIWFWTWWLRWDHVVSWPGMLLSSSLVGWTTLLPGWFFYFALRMRRANPNLALPDGRIAMVVTKAPSEPWPLVRTTLEAMLAQRLPHGRQFDVWLADEDPSGEVQAWCHRHHVQVSTRRGVSGYNNPTWPGRRKCKEGNLRYFYEVAGGYSRYEFVVQLDADHVPAPDYLANMIRPFADPRVGYVAAPSICDTNAKSSWAARARLYAEATLHGPLQAGYYGDFAPLCIGSHYAVRTCALKDAGGLGPELAEDHSTTLGLVGSGWRGAFALDAIAHGDGPASLADCLTQEYQWSRSLMRVLLAFTPRYWQRLSLPLQIEFGFAQIWYPLFALHLLVATLVPPIALLTRTPWVEVDFFDFVAHSWALTAACIAPVLWLRQSGLLRPANAPVLSWEATLFQLLRWPWVLLGITHAVIGHVLRKEFEFRVTPKAPAGAKPIAARLILPYAAIVVVHASTLIAVGDAGRASGYYWLGLTTAAMYMLVLTASVLLHVRESLSAQFGRLRALAMTTVSTAPVVLCTALLVGAAAALRGDAALAAILPVSSPAAALVADGAPQDLLVTQATVGFIQVRPQLPTQTGVADALDRVITTTRGAAPAMSMASLELPTDRLTLGAYDPTRQIPLEDIGLEHWYVRQDDPAALAAALKHAQNRHTVMVTVEPYLAAGDKSPVLDLIQQGRLDPQIRMMARTVASSAPQIVLVRWGHEMELSGLYPWAANDPELYREAFRRVVDIFRTEGATNARFVWSPAGSPGADVYYPGDDVVDYIGLTVLGDAQWDADAGEAPRSFVDLFAPRYALVAQHDKPIMVAELGVSGDRERQASWLQQASASVAQFALLRAVVYFNAPNPWPGSANVAPDWRITPELLRQTLALKG
jgi:cellulose synthase (UDP-forming)